MGEGVAGKPHPVRPRSFPTERRGRPGHYNEKNSAEGHRDLPCNRKHTFSPLGGASPLETHGRQRGETVYTKKPQTDEQETCYVEEKKNRELTQEDNPETRGKGAASKESGLDCGEGGRDPWGIPTGDRQKNGNARKPS